MYKMLENGILSRNLMRITEPSKAGLVLTDAYLSRVDIILLLFRFLLIFLLVPIDTVIPVPIDILR